MTNSARDASCPICRRDGEAIVSFEFAPKAPLSSHIAFRWCQDCDFMFAENLDAESYRDFYRTALRDTGHVSDLPAAGNLHRQQAEHLLHFLGAEFSGRCLDYGCGEGQLLEHLGVALPDAQLFGCDLRNSLRPGNRAEFIDDLDSHAGSFDLIVLSHVAEHLTDLDDIRGTIARLSPRGVLYIEVPDPLAYAACPRREFMYYFDRLHVNHFSRSALVRWLQQHGMHVVAHGTHRFDYRDGAYPAQFVFAAFAPAAPHRAEAKPSLREAFHDYSGGERRRSDALRDGIAAVAHKGLLVYGCGDNYYRAKAPGGPLHDLPVAAILDRDAARFPLGMAVPVIEPAQGLAQYPDAAVVVTISAGAESVVSDIRRLHPERNIILV